MTKVLIGNDKGTDLPSLHENNECLVNLNAPSDELPTTLITPPILEDYVIEAGCPDLSMRWWISLWWKSTLTIRLRTCEDVAP